MKNLTEIRKLNEGQQDFELGAMSNDDKKKFIDTVQDLYWKRKFKIDRSSVSLGKYLNMRAGNNDLAKAIKDLQNLGFKAKNWRSHKIQMESVNEETISEAQIITIKSSILKNADWDGSRDKEENPKGLTIQQFITIEAKKFKLKVKFQNNKGSMQGQSSDLMIISGTLENLIKYFNEYYDARIKPGDKADLLSFSESKLSERKFKWNKKNKNSAGFQKEGFKARKWLISEATGREIVLDWDMDDPREYAADWQDQGVYLDDWNKRKMEIEVSGAEKDLLKWLVNDYGLDKKDAQNVIRKGKKVKL